MSSGRILVVDDEAPNRTLVRRVLEESGFDVEEAADGDLALDAVGRSAPDLVLLDIQMPRRDGHSVLRALKWDPRTRLIPVVMLTSHEQLPDRVQAIGTGADDYLTKPFHVAGLAARVRSLVSLKRYTDELEHASKVLHSIARVVEERDAYTGEHCMRVGLRAVRMGMKLGLGDEDLRTLRLAGAFHDLGKIAVPDAVLRKPGKLTAEEFDLMKTHTVVGAQLVEPMRTMSRVLPLIRHHHERLDGSGYPDRLSKAEIPVTVRIVSVADIYDALATRRPYKEALPRETCLRILREEAARGWWDRDVVETLAALPPDEPA
jgi:putative two-component system response regulator